MGLLQGEVISHPPSIFQCFVCVKITDHSECNGNNNNLNLARFSLQILYKVTTELESCNEKPL